MIADFHILKPSGVLDAAQAKQLRQEIESHLTSESETSSSIAIFVVDLSQTTFIDSSGLGSLVLAYKSVKTAHKQFYLCSVGEQARMLFELTGLDQVFEMISDRANLEQPLAEPLCL